MVPWLLLCCRSLEGGALPPPAGDPAQGPQGLPQVWGCPTWDLGLDISLSSRVNRRLILNMQKACVVWFGGFSETHNRWIFMDKFFGVSPEGRSEVKRTSVRGVHGKLKSQRPKEILVLEFTAKSLHHFYLKFNYLM